MNNNENAAFAEAVQQAEQEALAHAEAEALKSALMPPSVSIEALQQRIVQQTRIRDMALSAFTATEIYQQYLREDGKLLALRELLATLTATE